MIRRLFFLQLLTGRRGLDCVALFAPPKAMRADEYRPVCAQKRGSVAMSLVALATTITPSAAWAKGVPAIKQLRWHHLPHWQRYSTPGEREDVLAVDTARAIAVEGRPALVLVRIRRTYLTTITALPCPGTEPLDHWSATYTDLRRCAGPVTDVADRFMSFERDMLERIGLGHIYDVPLFADNGDWYEPVAPAAALDVVASGLSASHGVIPVQLGAATLGAVSGTRGHHVQITFRSSATSIVPLASMRAKNGRSPSMLGTERPAL